MKQILNAVGKVRENSEPDDLKVGQHNTINATRLAESIGSMFNNQLIYDGFEAKFKMTQKLLEREKKNKVADLQ